MYQTLLDGGGDSFGRVDARWRVSRPAGADEAPKTGAVRREGLRRRRRRRGAIPICRATTPTNTSRARRSSGRRNSKASGSRKSRAKELADLIQEAAAAGDRARAVLNGAIPTGKIAGPTEFRDNNEISQRRPALVRRRSAGRQDSADHCRRPPAHRRAAARAAAASATAVYDSYEDLSLYDRCITRGYPGSMLPAIYGDSYQIVQGQGFVAIRYRDDSRNPRHPARQSAAREQGHRARHGRSARPLGRQHAGRRDHQFPGSQHLSQRQPREAAAGRTLHPDSPETIEWAVTVDDPTTWTRPWTFSMPLTMNDREPLYEYACHEGNYAIKNMLSGSRVAEEAAATSSKVSAAAALAACSRFAISGAMLS